MLLGIDERCIENEAAVREDAMCLSNGPDGLRSLAGRGQRSHQLMAGQLVVGVGIQRLAQER